MIKKLTYPKVLLFDCFETIIENDILRWKQLFKKIISINNWDLDANDFWNLWKKYEVNFRKVRTNMKKIEDSPVFKTYEKAWSDCFNVVFNELKINGNSEECAKLCIESMAQNEPYEDSIEILNKLKSNHKIGVISNADNDFLLPVLDKLCVSFDYILSSENANCYKPNPNIFKKFIHQNKLDPKECWYIGDKEFDDVQGSSSVGMQPFLINRRVYNEIKEFDNHIQISNLKQLYLKIKTI